MGHAENKLQWCTKKAEKEGKEHRGIKIIEPNPLAAAKHIKKAEHNLKTMIYLIKGNLLDWAISASFYTHYHCLLAILQNFGYESRNQECTFAAVECLINERKIDMPIEKLKRLFSLENRELMEKKDILSLREEYQYSTETIFDVEEIRRLVEETKEFLEETKNILNLGRNST